MNFNRMYGLFLRHFFLIKSSFPRILDLIYWPSIQIILWGFISKFFSTYSDYYNNTVGIILTCAILYDFLFRSSISFNMLFLEEIWSRNFTNLFIAPMKISEIIISLVFTALVRTLIGLVPAILLTSPLFGKRTVYQVLFGEKTHMLFCWKSDVNKITHSAIHGMTKIAC